MPHGHLTAFFLFEVGDAIDLETVGAQIDVTVSARLPPRPATPPYIQYQQPPLTMDAAAIGLADVNGFRVRLKAFDYGVISVALTRELPETWDALLESGLEWQEDGRLEKHAERLCRELLGRIAGAVTRQREGQFLNEDYFVFTVFSDGASETAEALLATRGGLIAQLLRNERQQLSSQEREEVSAIASRTTPPTSSLRPGTARSCMTRRVASPACSRFSSSPTRSFSSFVTTTTCWTCELARTYARLQLRRLAAGRGSVGATPAQRGRFTRSSSTSTSSRTRRRTR